MTGSCNKGKSLTVQCGGKASERQNRFVWGCIVLAAMA